MVDCRNLGPAGLQFIRKTLEAGDHLAHFLLDRPIEHGVAFAFLPRELDIPQTVSFDYEIPGNDASSSEASQTRTFEFVTSYLQASPAHLAIWEGNPELLTREPARNQGDRNFWDVHGRWVVWAGQAARRPLPVLSIYM